MFMQIRRGLEPCTDESNFTKTAFSREGRICQCHGICTVLARDEGLTVNDYGTLYTLLISAVAVTT
jgi:hypothetical protein